MNLSSTLVFGHSMEVHKVEYFALIAG